MPLCRYSQAWLAASSWLRSEVRELESWLEVLLASSLSTKRKRQPNCLADILGSLIKQQRRQRLRKRHLKSEFALLQTLSLLFHLVQFVKCWHFFLKLNSKWLYRSSGKEKESRLSLLCLVFAFSTKREIRYFHVVVVQWWQRNIQKSVMHVHSCYFVSINVLHFCRSCWRCRRRFVSSFLPK